MTEFLPAGFSDSENDEYDDYEGYYFEKPKNKENHIQKSEFQEFTENLLSDLKNNNVSDLRKQLDKGISTGFDIDSPVDKAWNLLYYACSFGLPEILTFLIEERGVTLDTRIDGMTPLMVACQSKQQINNDLLKVVQILVNKEPKLINRTNYLGENSLMHAAREGHLKLIEYLINAGESYDTINNSGRNVLFYAIEGNRIEVAKKLFEMEIDLDIKDCTGTTAKKLAEECNAMEILQLFPPEEYKYETPSTYFSYNNFDSIIPNTLGENSVPSYFPDIICMLRGMDCEKYITLFSQSNITLEQFLTIDENGLEEIGIPLPYQRKLILLGLHNFFNAKWTNKSVYIPEHIKSNISPIDRIYVMANVLRQAIILKSQLIYLKRLKTNYGINYPFDNFSVKHFQQFHELVNELNRNTKTMKVTKRPLLIGKQNRSIESNVLKGSQIYTMTRKALNVILPVTIMSIIMVKLFYRK